MVMTTQARSVGTSARRLIGMDVEDASGAKVGELNDVILDVQTGRAIAAIVDEGGFLGVRERHHGVPWSALRPEVSERRVVASFDRDSLQASPALDRENPPDWADPEWQRQAERAYGVSDASAVGPSSPNAAAPAEAGERKTDTAAATRNFSRGNPVIGRRHRRSAL